MKAFNLLFLSAMFLILSACQASKSNIEREKKSVVIDAPSRIRIALIDTQVCQLTSYQKYKKVLIHPPKDMTDSLRPPQCDSLAKFKKRIHGHFVLQSFLNELDTIYQVEVFPIVVFDRSGRQKAEYWKKAIKAIEELKPQVVLTASGYIGKDINEIPNFIGPPIFAAAGSVGRGVKQTTELWPQKLTGPQVFLIGHYIQPTKELFPGEKVYDPGLLYQDRIFMYFEKGKRRVPLKGTSRAVAIALARSINKCPRAFLFRNTEKIRSCLKEKMVEIKFNSGPQKVGYTLKVL